MKKLLSVVLLIAILATAAAGCGKEKTEDKNRVLFNLDLENYVELGKYKEINVDKSSTDFENMYDEFIDNDIANNEFYESSQKLTEGKVEKGDIANIDYVGKKGGIAFDGGTAQGYDLEIGSGSFIPGFEDGLIGVEIGTSVDLDLTFPEQYQNADLAGAKVVFSVKVNYLERKTKKSPENYYSELGFKTVEDYYKDVENRVIENYLLNSVMEESKIKKYPKADVDLIYNTYENMIAQNLTQQYNMSLESYLSSMGQTKEEFKKSIVSEQIEPQMDSQLVLYAIFDAENLKFEQSDIDKKINEELKSINNSSVTKDVLLEYYGDFYFEEAVVREMVIDFIIKNAKIS